MLRSTNSLKRLMLRLTLVLLTLAMAQLVFAADIVVEDDCSLGEAITAANDDRAVDSCAAGSGPADTIILKKSEWRSDRLPPVTSTIHIEGGRHDVTIGGFPAFVVDGGTLVLRNLDLRFNPRRNAMLLKINKGALTLDNTIFHNCSGFFATENSEISLKGGSKICDHNIDVVMSWFGVPLPGPLTCKSVSGATVSAAYGLASGVQCQPVDGGGIGVQSIVDAGYIDAVDVWGYVEQGVELCFSQRGSLTFLDAATSPRTVSTIESYSKNGNTCTYMTRAGTVVLAPGAPPEVASSATTTTTTDAPLVDGCPVTAIGHLKFLESPASDAELVGYIPRGAAMVFVSRILGWYQVSYGGQTAWVGGRYAQADC